MRLSTFIIDNIEFLLQYRKNFAEIVGSVDNSSSEGLRPATCSRDPEILLNAQHDCTEIDRAGSREQVAGRRDSNGQQTLFKDQQNTRTFRNHAKDVLLAIALDLQQTPSKIKQVANTKALLNQDHVRTISSIFYDVGQMEEVFSLKDIAAEYRFLRKKVIQCWSKEHTSMDALDLEELMRFNEALDRLLEESIITYTVCEEKIRQMAHFDDLTGLPNRRLFRDRLNQAIKHVKRENKIFALLLIDLDRFKDVNDQFGHEAGDAVLRDVGARISVCIRETDTVARIGGDEFSLILLNVRDAEKTQMIVKKILNELEKPFQIENKCVYISGSIGITLCPRDGLDDERLLRNADRSMYLAKKSSLNQFCFHD